MEFEYSYPMLSENWDFWIIRMNIERELEKIPRSFSGTTKSVCVVFDDPLSEAEKAKLDKLMADKNVGIYPSNREGYTIFVIQDIWDFRSVIESAVGRRVKWLHMLPPLPDGRHTMELWLDGTLNPAEKRKVKEAYARLISE